MKKLILAVIFLVSAFSSAWAQNSGTMKDLALKEMFRYGVTLYDRSFYLDSATVFSTILMYDGKHEGALEYMRKMGYKIGEVPLRVYAKGASKARAAAAQVSGMSSCCEMPGIMVSESRPIHVTPKTTVAVEPEIENLDPLALRPGVVNPDEVIRQAIVIEEKAIKHLNGELARMRVQPEAIAHE